MAHYGVPISVVIDYAFGLHCEAATGQEIHDVLKSISLRLGVVSRRLLIPFTCLAFALPAAGQDTTVKLTVTVKENDGKTPIGTALVNVYQANKKGSDWFARPPDYQSDTNAQGIARFDIRVKRGEKLSLSIEASREDFTAKREELDYDANLPPQILKQFFLEPRAKEKTGDATTTVKVHVTQKGGEALEGATVNVNGSSGGTNASGDATILTALSNVFDVTVSKELFAEKKQQTRTKDRPKEVGPIEFVLERETGTAVSVTVTDERNNNGVGDALVVFDGPDYYRGTTDGTGKATIMVREPGKYNARVTQQYYETLNDELSVTAGEQTKTASFALTQKQKKLDEKDTIEATVLAKDPSEKSSKPTPLKGAEVKAGRYSVGTDENGQAVITGSYERSEQVTASAPGYKSQTKTVGLNKLMRYAAGTGKVTFTLEPELSKEDPVNVIVEVRDPSGASMGKGVGVEFYLMDGTTYVWGAATEKSGERDFSSEYALVKDVALLRQGIKIKIKHTGYKEHESVISSDLLQPSAQARRYTVQLEKDWTELSNELAALDGRVAALRNQIQTAKTKSQSVDQLSAKFPAARGRVEALLAELKAAQKAFDAKLSGMKCQEAGELVKSIQSAQAEAVKKEGEIKAALDEANRLVANCKSKADGAAAKAKHRSAIKLTGEIGVLGKNAAETNSKLARFVEAMKEGGTLQTQLQQTADKVGAEVTTAAKDANTANSNFNDAFVASKGVAGQRAGLLDEFNKLKAKYEVPKYYDKLPQDIRSRVDNFEAALGKGGADMSLSFVDSPDLKRIDDVIKPTLTQLEQYKSQADGIVSAFKSALCNVQPMDNVIEDLRAKVTNAGFDLGLAADLPAKADACGTDASSPSPSPSASPSPSPSPDDQITVPDVSKYEDTGAMKAAAGPDMVGIIIQTKATPPPGSTKLFASQDPPANSKSKRGKALKIFVYQSLVSSSSPSPSLSPSPSASASASSSANEDITVPDVSRAANDVGALKAAAGPDMVGIIIPTKATPPPGSTKLLASQDPPANSKSKRGKSLKIFVYQSLTSGASPSPATSPATTGGIPKLIGLTLEQAVSRVPKNMRIGGDEVGDAPPKPELAFTIFAQTPPPGTKFDSSRPPVVTVKRYGSAKAATAARFDGQYFGSYSGDDKGRVSFTVTNGSINITSPGTGSGTVSSSGSANFSGAGTNSDSSYTFSGSFSIGPDGKASARGNWSGQQQGFRGSGTWRASRP